MSDIKFRNVLLTLYPGRDAYWYVDIERQALAEGRKTVRKLLKWLVSQGIKPWPNWFIMNRAQCRVLLDGKWYIVARNGDMREAKSSKGVDLNLHIKQSEYTACTPYEPAQGSGFPPDTVIVAYRWWTDMQLRVMTNNGFFTCDEDGVVIM